MGAIAIVAVAALLISGGVGYYAVENGYVPVDNLFGTGFSTLDQITPPGKYREIPTDNLTNCKIVAEIMDEIPHIDEISYTLYETDVNIIDVLSEYKIKTQNEGYSLEYEGNITYTVPFYYQGYLKGKTAVGVVASSSIPGYDTVILYTTGDATHYVDIIEWMNVRINNETTTI